MLFLLFLIQTIKKQINLLYERMPVKFGGGGGGDPRRQGRTM